MNFSQLQERVRHVLLRRIERGTLSVSLLARQTGLGQPHLSNFLHNRRGLSHHALDRILEAQHLDVADLLPARRESTDPLTGDRADNAVWIPLVPHSVAIFEPYIRVSSIQAMLPFFAADIKGLEARCSAPRKQWDRFVAIRASAEDARAMEPLLEPEAIVLLDRHYTSFHPYLEGRPNLYAARVDSGLILRYAQSEAERVILRALRGQTKATIVEPDSSETPSDLLIGRAALIQNPL